MDFWQIVMAAATQGGGAPVPEVLGNELFAQPDFDASTNLTLNGWAVAGGEANSQEGLGYLTATALETLDTGNYRWVAEVAAGSNVNALPVLYVAGDNTVAIPASVGVHTGILTVSSVTLQTIRIRDTAEVSFILTAFSLKKIQ